MSYTSRIAPSTSPSTWMLRVVLGQFRGSVFSSELSFIARIRERHEKGNYSVSCPRETKGGR